MKLPCIFSFIITISNINAQEYPLFKQTLDSIYALSQLDEQERKIKSEALISSLKKVGKIPLAENDSVAFIYFGEAQSVKWMGDFNAWGFSKEFKSEGTNVTGTDIWILKASFPGDARLDYKILLNGNTWILDPNNANLQWSGVGGGSPNSELRMPEFKEDTILNYQEDIAHGKLVEDVLYTCKTLGYQLTYSVYTPNPSAGPIKGIVYVTDGYEYLHPQLGNMATVLDNLIAGKKIVPVVAVFLDHREPANRINNRRMQELAMNENYLNFYVDEFVPYIESHHSIHVTARERAIMGSSIGGLNATFFAFSRPDVFGLAGIQSPTFWTHPKIYSLCDDPTKNSVNLSITSGLINDSSEGTRKMINILENNACVYHYREVNQGQSWGNWKNLIDDILVDFFFPRG